MDFALMSGKKKTSFEFGRTLCATLFAIIFYCGMMVPHWSDKAQSLV